jgi:hypothetical protein
LKLGTPHKKGGENMARSGSSNQTVVPQARGGLDTMKFEVASQLGVNLKQGYNGDIPAREAGRVGGNMVKKMIQYAENNLSGISGPTGTRGGF